MNKVTFCLIAIFVVVFCGCAGDCIRVGGSYDGIDGTLEYCFNGTETRSAGVPAFKTGDKMIYGFDEEQVAMLVEMIEMNVGTMRAADIRKAGHPVRQILHAIGDAKND